MRPERRTGLLFASLIILALATGACTRSASTPQATSGAKGQTPGAVSGQQATMEAVRSALLTQTAQAAANPATKTPTATPLVSLGTPTPTVKPTSLTPFPTLPSATPIRSGQTQYTVQLGDWVYSIARKFGVNPDDIISLNNLAYPYTVTVGQVLKIPTGGSLPFATSTPGGPTVTPGGPTLVPGTRTYIVQEGEWVYSIARKFGVDPQAIIDANHLQYPYTLHPADTLVIP